MAAMSVRVQVPPGAQITAVSKEAAFCLLQLLDFKVIQETSIKYQRYLIPSRSSQPFVKPLEYSNSSIKKSSLS
ncbi:MAG TPA: hypothetical protein PLQ78_04490, partial [Flavipsychrobacter sp.]|nr:hypothetical protein [Flavipsychrobacter sp.]